MGQRRGLRRHDVERSLLGVPPSGAYQAKELLLGAAAETQQWWWAVVLQAGGWFTAGYLILVLAHALGTRAEPVRPRVPVARGRQAVALGLALCSLALGLVPWGALLPIPPGAPSNPLAFSAFVKTLWPVLGGAVLAILIGRWRRPLPRVVTLAAPVRRLALAAGGAIVGVDSQLQRWPVAGLGLLGLAIAFGAAMLAGR